MRSPKSVDGLTKLGRVRLSDSFFMRDFLFSEISQIEGVSNIPDNPDLAIEVGKMLCSEVLEPIQEKLGRISIRSAFRSAAVNQIGNEKKYNCASNEANYAGHIWDHLDSDGCKGATACIVVNSFIPYYEETGNWQALAWWIHDNIPSYADLEFYPKYAAFNISWYEGEASKSIRSYIAPKGCLTKLGMKNQEEDHSEIYAEYLQSIEI